MISAKEAALTPESHLAALEQQFTAVTDALSAEGVSAVGYSGQPVANQLLRVLPVLSKEIRETRAEIEAARSGETPEFTPGVVYGL